MSVESEQAREMIHLLRQTAAFAGGERLVAHQGADPLHYLSDREQPLHPGEVDAAIVDQPLDRLEALQLAARIEPHATDRPARLNEAEPLVLAERLRVHAEHPRRDADEIQLFVNPHCRPCCLRHPAAPWLPPGAPVAPAVRTVRLVPCADPTI